MLPGGPIQQPYSYSVPSPHILFKIPAQDPPACLCCLFEAQRARSEVPSYPTDGADTSPGKHALLISSLLQQTNFFIPGGFSSMVRIYRTCPNKNLVATPDRIKEYRIQTVTTYNNFTDKNFHGTSEEE